MTKSPRSKNAFKYGLHSTEIVLPWESEEDFNELHEGLRQEYFPNGASEEETIQDIARCYWAKRRLVIGSQAAFRGPNSAALREAGKKGGWDGVFEYLHSHTPNASVVADLQNDISRKIKLSGTVLERFGAEVLAYPARVDARGETRDERKARLAALRTPSATQEEQRRKVVAAVSLDQQVQRDDAGPDDDVVVMGKLLRQFGELIDEQADQISAVSRSIVELKKHDEGLVWFNSAIRPDLIEKVFKIEAEINRQIDKLFRRLVNLKEMKSLYSPKVVTMRPVSRLPAKKNSV